MIEFEKRNIKPMLIGIEEDPFDSEDYIYELKWDGERCIAYLDPAGNVDLRNKRNVKMLQKAPELKDIWRQAKTKCILDGELMVLKDGKPDFFEIQRRSLTTNKIKIDLASKRYPATFIAFDVLYYDRKDVCWLPLIERKKLLQKSFIESERLALSRYIEQNGTLFYRMAEEQELEGIVAKRMDSFYIQGKHTKEWAKIKHMMDEDFVICGYIPKRNHMFSLVLGKFGGAVIIYQGHVTMGVGRDTVGLLQTLPPGFPPAGTPVGHDNENAIWVQPKYVGVVKYMPRAGSSERHQSVFKGLRYDKTPEECKL
jgi:ATP dependent DNA ligase domain